MLRDILYDESRAMAEFALKRGKRVPSSTIKSIEAYVIDKENSSQSGSGDSNKMHQQDMDITDLVNAHDNLSKIVEPATPQAISLLQIEQESPSF